MHSWYDAHHFPKIGTISYHFHTIAVGIIGINFQYHGNNDIIYSTDIPYDLFWLQ